MNNPHLSMHIILIYCCSRFSFNGSRREFVRRKNSWISIPCWRWILRFMNFRVLFVWSHAKQAKQVKSLTFHNNSDNNSENWIHCHRTQFNVYNDINSRLLLLIESLWLFPKQRTHRHTGKWSNKVIPISCLHLWSKSRAIFGRNRNALE